MRPATNPAADSDVRAPLVEVFHSIQGEGRYLGVPMTFVRTATCPIRCRYCDTPDSYRAPKAVIGADDAVVDNPVDVRSTLALADAAVAASPLGCGDPWRVSLTGGEPLVFPAFARALGRAVCARGGRLHLETAALDAEALDLVLDVVDHVSADWKLPETLASGGDHTAAHAACVARAVARDGVSVDVKIVVTAGATDASFAHALDALTPFADAIVLVVQPVTPFGDEVRKVAIERVVALCGRAVAAGFDARVIPQLHPVLGVD